MLTRVYKLGLAAGDLLTQDLPSRDEKGKKTETKAEVMARIAEYAIKHPPLPQEEDSDRGAVELKFREEDYEKLQKLAEKMNLPLISLILITAARMVDEQKSHRAKR